MTDHPTCGPDADAPQGPTRRRIVEVWVKHRLVELPLSKRAWDELDAAIRADQRTATLADVERVVEGMSNYWATWDGTKYVRWNEADKVLAALSPSRENGGEDNG